MEIKFSINSSNLFSILKENFTILEDTDYFEISLPKSEHNRYDVALQKYEGGIYKDIGIRWNSDLNRIKITNHGNSLGFKRVDVSGKWRLVLHVHNFAKYEELIINIAETKKHYEWLVGQTHVHSTCSDGTASIDQIIMLAEDKKVDFICFTDHNTVQQNYLIKEGNENIVLIPGYEFTNNAGNHVNFWGVDEPINSFIWDNPNDGPFEKMIEGKKNGAVVSINHPFCHQLPWKHEFKEFDSLEIWNGGWRDMNESAFKFWQDQIKKGNKIVAVCGKDFHTPNFEKNDFAQPLTCVLSKARDTQSILNGILDGKVYLKDNKQEINFSFTSGNFNIGEISNEKTVRIKIQSEEDIVTTLHSDKEDIQFNYKNIDKIVELNSKFAYISIRYADNGKICLISNPIYFEDHYLEGEHNDK